MKITSEVEHLMALERILELMGKESAVGYLDEDDELNILANAVVEYEKKHFPME